MKDHKFLAIFEIIMATIFLSTSGLWTKLSGQDAFVLAFFRSLVPILFLLTLNYLKIHNGKKRVLTLQWNKSLVIASILNALRSLLFFTGLLLTDISKAVVMLYTWPIFALIINIIIKREPLSIKNIFLMLVSFSGIVVIYIQNFIGDTIIKSDILGMSVMIFSSLIYSITFVIFKIHGNDKNHFEITFFQNFAAVPIFLVGIIIKYIINGGNTLVSITLQGVGFASLNGLLIGIFGFVLYFKGLKKLPASLASQLSFFEIIFASLWSFFLFGDRPGVTFILGAILIITGALGGTIRKR